MRRHLSYWLLATVAIFLVGATITACGKDDEEEPAPPTVLSVNPTSVSLISTFGSSATVNVKCSGSWTVTECPDWLNLSARSGNGDTAITLTTLSENNTATMRQGVITFTCEDLTAQVSVSQVAGVMSGLEVNVDDEVVLINSATFKLSYGNKVDYMLSGYFSASSAGWSDDKILEALQSADPMSAADTQTLTASDLYSGTTYVQCFVGYDTKGNHGEVIRRSFTTPSYSNLADAPQATIDNVRYNPYYWFWGTYINASADLYYQIYSSGDMAFLMGLLLEPSDFAMLIKDSLSDLTSYKNSYEDWKIERGSNDNDVVIGTWAQRDGKWSGVANVFWGHLSGDDVKKKAISSSNGRPLLDGERGKPRSHSADEIMKLRTMFKVSAN